MATYVNDLRLTELATGEGSGTWGTTTNTSLELIGEALGYATQQAFGSDADATTTVADGASDPARAMYYKITSAASLTATRTLTIAPNTISRVMFIENATSGSQSIAISQGSGASVTIATGKTAVVYLDGAGATAAVVDAMAGVDPGVTDTLAEVLTAGNTTTTDQKIQFRDTGIYINSSADGQLDIVADTEIQIAATTVDVNGTLAFDSLKGTGATTVTNILDEDNMASDSATAIATQQSIKAYVDSQVGTVDTLAEILANGNTTGANDIDVDSAQKVQFRDAAIYINSSVDGQLDIVADTEIQIAATTIDINGAINASGEIIAASLDISGDIDVDGTANLDVVDIDGAVDMASTLAVGGKVRVGAATDGTSALMTFDSALNFSSLQMGNNSGTGSAGGVLLYGSSGNEFALYQYAGAVGSETYGAPTFALNSIGGATFTPSASGFAVFNEGGFDADFRVESDGNANMLLVDASANRVGVGISPTETLHVNGRSRIQNLYLGEISSNLDIVQATSSAGLYLVGGSSDVTIGTAGFIFNEGGADKDFRVESDSNANMLFVDAGNNRVGVGSATPSSVLEVTGTFAVRSSSSSTFNDSSNAENVRMLDAGTIFNADGIDKDFTVASNDNANMLFVDGGNNRVHFGSNANIENNRVQVTAPKSLVGGIPQQSLGVNDSTAMAEGVGGSIDFTGQYLDNGTYTSFASVEAYKTNASSGNYDGTLVLKARQHGGDQVDKLRLNFTEAVFNEDGLDTDFRVESDTNANAIFMDASLSYVGINKSPAVELDVQQVSTSYPLRISASGGVSRSMVFADSEGSPSRVNWLAGAQYNTDNGWELTPSTANGGYTFTNRVLTAYANGNLTVNENGIDADFRVESVSNAYGFFLDASRKAVGVNFDSNPSGYAQFGVRFSGSDSDVNSTGLALQDSGTNSNVSFCTFFNSLGSGIGSITRVGTTNAVAYNTTSDRRAKENIADADDAGAVIDAIQVRKFDWIEGNQHQPYGMIAQELITVAPEAVHQPANEEDMMGVDYSKLVPMLIKEIQSLRARVADLES
jgi:hypothetical protein